MKKTAILTLILLTTIFASASTIDKNISKIANFRTNINKNIVKNSELSLKKHNSKSLLALNSLSVKDLKVLSQLESTDKVDKDCFAVAYHMVSALEALTGECMESETYNTIYYFYHFMCLVNGL
jgi:hypothetical protein